MPRLLLLVLGCLAAAACVSASPCRWVSSDGDTFVDLTGLKNGAAVVHNASNAPALTLRGVCGDIVFSVRGCPQTADQVCTMSMTDAAAAPKWAERSIELSPGHLTASTSSSSTKRLSFAVPHTECTHVNIDFKCDVHARAGAPHFVGQDKCNVDYVWPSMFACPRSLKNQTSIDLLIDLALSESLAYDRLAEMTRAYGHRLSGTQSLEQSIDWVVERMNQEDNFDLVYTEPVTVPTWVRGNEYARIVAPRPIDITILGLGMSNGTGPAGIQGEVIVVESFEELEARADEIPGKIVLHNAPYVAYGINSQFRREGAIRAEQYGAIASIVRSITPFSLYTPHTGSMETAGIPGAAITLEDADLIASWISHGQRVELFLYMEAHFLPDSISRNIIAEIKGTTYPDEVVVFGGHIDSWDVGSGVLDDGGGAFVAWDALRLMAKYDIRPKRTVRAVFWTNEENGSNGGKVYKNNRVDELPKVSWAFESDSGTFSPIGIGFTGSPAALQIMTDIGSTYLARIGAGTVTVGGGGVDIEPMCVEGVPCSGLNVATNGRPDKLDSYFFYHHTKADTMTSVLPNELSLCTASLAAWAFAVADLDNLLPRLQ